MTIDEVNDILNQLAEELPDAFFYGLNGGIVLDESVKMQPESIGPNLYIMGEYSTDPYLGRRITIYYGSFERVHGHASREAYTEALRGTLRHEFRHHMEGLGRLRDLEVEDEIELAHFKQQNEERLRLKEEREKEEARRRAEEAEKARQAEEARRRQLAMEEEARRLAAEEQKRLEEARLAEEARQREAAREAERRAEEARRQEARRQEAARTERLKAAAARQRRGALSPELKATAEDAARRQAARRKRVRARDEKARREASGTAGRFGK